MKHMKKMLCLLLAFALLLTFGCKKDEEKEENLYVPGDSSTTVETPPAEQSQEGADDAVDPIVSPDLQPDYTISDVPADETADDWTALFNSYREVSYFMEWQLGDDYTILETLPGDAEGEYLLWGMHILEPGVREPFQLRVKVTPDGKDFSLLSKEFVEVSEEWKAVQNYRWLVTNWSCGPAQLLEALGFDSATEKNVTGIPFADFQAAMLSIMTEEMYDAHWDDYFWEEDSKLAIDGSFGASGDHYLVEMVQPQAEGGWLSYEFIHGNFDSFATFFVKVDLVEQPDGTFRVNGWDPDNTAIMEQAAIPMPIQP